LRAIARDLEGVGRGRGDTKQKHESRASNHKTGSKKRHLQQERGQRARSRTLKDLTNRGTTKHEKRVETPWEFLRGPKKTGARLPIRKKPGIVPGVRRDKPGAQLREGGGAAIVRVPRKASVRSAHQNGSYVASLV